MRIHPPDRQTIQLYGASIRAFAARNKLFLAIFVPLAVLLILLAIDSLGWHMEEVDTPLLLYTARMVDSHVYLLYRDIFDWQMPTVHLLFIGIGRLIGYTSEAAARRVDIASLTALLALTALWLKQLGWKVACSTAILFGLIYLSSGVAGIMEREYFALIPLAGALVVLTSARFNTRLKAPAVGFLFGVLTALKPIMGLGFPLVLVYLFLEIKDRAAPGRVRTRQVLPEAGLAAAGFALPIAVMIGYLASNGTLATFIGIAQNYWPLFSSVSFSPDTRALISVAPGDRVTHLLRQYLAFGGQPLWFVPAFVGAAITLRPGGLARGPKRLALLILGMAAVYSIYPVFSGQFWRYHWFPFQYFIIAGAALVFAGETGDDHRLTRRMGALALCLAMFQYEAAPSAVSILWDRYVLRQPPPSAKSDQAARIAAYLRDHMQPGDTVQGLDLVSGGVVQAMLIADAPTATRFYIDDGFYFHVSSPYIQGLRREFIQALGKSQPRFIVEAGQRPYLIGDDVSGRFDELQMLVDAHYQIVDQHGDYTIYERRATWDATAPQTVIAYPRQKSDFAAWLRDETGIQAIGMMPGQNIDQKLAAAEKSPGVVSLAFVNTELTDPDHAVEAAAGRRWFFIGEYWSKQARVVRYLAAPEACADMAAADVAFGDDLTLRAAASDVVQAGASRLVCANLKWQAGGSITRPYKVALHVVDGGGNVVAQYDGLLAAADGSMVGRVAVELPEGLAAGQYRLRLIVYDAETQARLAISPGVDAWEMGSINVSR